MKLPVLFLAISSATLLVSCGGKQVKSENEADSIKAEQPVPVEQQYLPDTMYASAKAVDFRVEEIDSAITKGMLQGVDRYQQDDRVLTFRKNPYRNADFGGKVSGTPSTIEVAWRFDTYEDYTPTRFGTWAGGSGWTGQPLYVKWTDEEMAAFRQSSPALTADFDREEVIVGSLCGRAYFINYKTGKESRKFLDTGNPIKGTMSLDPEYKNLYAGQGVPARQPFGCMAFDLLKHERTFFYNDLKAWRNWQAFDSSPVVVGGFLFWPGENGSLYKWEREQGKLTPHSVLRYRVAGMAPGIESSICVYRNYGFFSDNQGNVIAVNLNTMRPVWHYKNHDDSDASIVCKEENGHPYLYTACEVDKQGYSANCHFIKLDAIDGSLVWELQIPCNRKDFGTKILDGGAYATPLLGGGDCEGMIFANITRNSAADAPGQLTAISTKDGKIIYATPLKQFVWTSPVAFYNEKQEMFIFTGDSSGNVYLIRGKTGEILFTQPVANNFESSPVVVGNTAIVGSRGNGIYKFVIK